MTTVGGEDTGVVYVIATGVTRDLYRTLLSHGGVAVNVDNHTPGLYMVVLLACVLEWRRYGD